MNVRAVPLALAIALTGCVSVPPAPPAPVVQLQSELDRLQHDPRVAANGGAELAQADVAVNTLARDYRLLDQTAREQRIYIAGRLLEIAEASGRARFAEAHSAELAGERERLLTRASAPRSVAPARTVAGGEWLPPERRTLMAIQERLPNMESSLDARGLVVRFSEYQFQPDSSTPTPTAERSLDQLARVLRDEPNARVAVEGVGNAAGNRLALGRATAVRDYLDARGIESGRVTVRGVDAYDPSAADRRVDVVILAAR